MSLKLMRSSSTVTLSLPVSAIIYRKPLTRQSARAPRMDTKTRTAVFDPDAFYPFRALVKGPLTAVEELTAIEEFVRAYVLHDEMVMEMHPFSSSAEDEEEWTDEEIEAGGRMVIAGIGPTTAEYNLFNESPRPRLTSQIQLSPALESVAASYSNAGPGNIYYQAHLDLLKRVLETVRQGGSVVCRGAFIQEAIQTASAVPLDLFQNLDHDWKEFVETAKDSRFGPLVPPVLSIVLTRSAGRDKIPAVLRDLRDEWTEARSKVWDLADKLKSARTVQEARELERELKSASKYFSPVSQDRSSYPVQVLWELFVGTIGGAITATLIGGDPKVGAAGALVGQAIKTVQKDADFGRILFGRGAFDLAKRVRREIDRVELNALGTILSDSEKKALGF